MGTAYFNKKDIMTRLHGTVCVYDARPYYVDASVYIDDHVDIIPLASVMTDQAGKLKVKYTDPKFNYKSPALGYMFYRQKQAVYISRLPDRNQSQGLSQRVLYTQPKIPNYSQWQYTQEFEDMLLGKYPGRTTAELMLKSGRAESVPISRNMAISCTRKGLLEVYYKGRPVACSLMGRGIELYDLNEKSYMAKILAKDGIMLGA